MPVHQVSRHNPESMLSSYNHFFMEKVNDIECRLKRDHEYYKQVQGQMGVTFHCLHKQGTVCREDSL